jgi:hypothetical protein
MLPNHGSHQTPLQHSQHQEPVIHAVCSQNLTQSIWIQLHITIHYIVLSYIPLYSIIFHYILLYSILFYYILLTSLGKEPYAELPLHASKTRSLNLKSQVENMLFEPHIRFGMSVWMDSHNMFAKPKTSTQPQWQKVQPLQSGPLAQNQLAKHLETVS